MGDMADDLIEQGMDQLSRHIARECDTDWCEYCLEEWEYDRQGEK